MIKHSRQSGFTLVEVLITMTVLSMVMLTGAWAYSFISQNWQRNTATYNESLAQYTDWKLIQRAVTNTLPKIVRGDGDELGFYFLGRENGFTAVTQTSVQNPDYPAVYRLFREPDPDSNAWQLVYEEAVLRDVGLFQADQQLPFNFRLEMETPLEQVLFEYYGWENLRARIESDPDQMDSMTSSLATPEWYTEYDGMNRNLHPLVIQVHIGDFIWPFEIPDISTQLRNRSTDPSV